MRGRVFEGTEAMCMQHEFPAHVLLLLLFLFEWCTQDLGHTIRGQA